MSLRVKIISLCVVVTLLVSSCGMWIFVKSQEEFMIQNAMEQADHHLNLLCDNMKALGNRLEIEMSELASQSLVQYYFAQYAHVLQTEQIQYSLVSDEKYLYHVGSHNVLEKEINQEGRIDDEIYCRMTELNLLGRDTYQIYIAEDLSVVYERIETMERTAWWLQGGCTVVLLLTLSIIMMKSLRPIEELNRQAREIAAGRYNLRSEIKGRDEIGQLAGSFNKMAAAVEEKIDKLTEESENRKLLLGALSHELKTPMTAVIGYADSLLHLPLSEAEKISCAEKIYNAAKRTERLSWEMMELISMDKHKTIEKQWFVTKELTEVLGIMWPNVKILCETKELYGDPVLLQSLLSNLIDNAVKASDGDEVVVEIGEKCFKVTDRGKGIPEEHVKHLTDPFYRVDKARSRKNGGVGLGLALCQRIVEAHDGHLKIESEVGKGTVVTVKFP